MKFAAVLALAGVGLAACAGGVERRGSVQRQGTLTEAVASPLEDINLRRIEIPEVLQRAVADPYDPRGMGECRAIAAEVRRLDEALGPDRDEPPAPQTGDERVRTARSAAVTVVREGARSAVPFRGWVRQLSGAARHQEDVQQAIIAGGTRRGYLKGVGMRLNCAPPAAPSWFTPVRQAPARAAPARRR